MNIITRPWTVWRGWVNKDHTGHHSMFNSVFKQQDKYWEMSEYWIFKKILVAYRNWIFDMVRKNLRTCDKGKEKKKRISKLAHFLLGCLHLHFGILVSVAFSMHFHLLYPWKQTLWKTLPRIKIFKSSGSPFM